MEEGWNQIWQIKYSGDYIDPLEELQDMSQDSFYHTKSLMEHCELVEQIVGKKSPDNKELRDAAYNHDVGKYWTKTFIDSKGYPSPTAHYYGHENYGAYMFLLNPFREESLRTAALISHHMRPYVWDVNENAKQKDMDWMGSFADDLIILHEADKDGH